jgi:hypothetical protein
MMTNGHNISLILMHGSAADTHTNPYDGFSDGRGDCGVAPISRNPELKP